MDWKMSPEELQQAIVDAEQDFHENHLSQRNDTYQKLQLHKAVERFIADKAGQKALKAVADELEKKEWYGKRLTATERMQTLTWIRQGMTGAVPEPHYGGKGTLPGGEVR